MDYTMHNTNTSTYTPPQIGSVFTGLGTISSNGGIASQNLRVTNEVGSVYAGYQGGNSASVAVPSYPVQQASSLAAPSYPQQQAAGAKPKKQPKVDKSVYKQSKLEENCVEWANKFCQAYMMYLNQENVHLFYKKDSRLTYMDVKSNEGGITYTKGEYVGPEAIATHLQIFRCLSNYQVSVFEVQPAGDKKSIEVYMMGKLTPSGGYPKNFTMALTLGKATNQTIPLPDGELKTPQYIHNQFFTLQ